MKIHVSWECPRCKEQNWMVLDTDVKKPRELVCGAGDPGANDRLTTMDREGCGQHQHDIMVWDKEARLQGLSAENTKEVHIVLGPLTYQGQEYSTGATLRVFGDVADAWANAGLVRVLGGPGSCRVCGCTEEDPCWDDEEGACHWAEAGLCSRCEAKAEKVDA